MMLSVDRVLSLNVNVAYSALEDADLSTVAARLDNAGLFFDADDLSDDTAYGSDLVTDCEVVSHISDLLILLFLLTRGNDHKYDHYTDDKHHREHREKISTGI